MALFTSAKVKGAFNASNWVWDKVSRCILSKKKLSNLSSSDSCGVLAQVVKRAVITAERVSDLLWVLHLLLGKKVI